MPATTRRVFWAAYAVKKWALCNGIPLVGTLADALVFNKVRANLGGRIRCALSGGAPISEHTHEFLSVAVCPIYQGYGMTEGTAMAGLFTPKIPFSIGHVGVPVACVNRRNSSAMTIAR